MLFHLCSGWWSLSRELVLASHGIPSFAVALDILTKMHKFCRCQNFSENWTIITYIASKSVNGEKVLGISLNITTSWNKPGFNNLDSTTLTQHLATWGIASPSRISRGLFGKNRSQRGDTDQAARCSGTVVGNPNVISWVFS